MTKKSEALRARLKAASPEDRLALVDIVNARRRYEDAVDACDRATEHTSDRAHNDRVKAITELRSAVAAARSFGIVVADDDVYGEGPATTS